MGSPRTLSPTCPASALFVITRNSTEVYKGKAVDVRQVARDLGVGYVLEDICRLMAIRCG